MLGDYGGQSIYPYKTILQKNISQQMNQVASRFKSQFVVTLGNNFFDSGVKNINDFRFQVLFYLIHIKCYGKFQHAYVYLVLENI